MARDAEYFHVRIFLPYILFGEVSKLLSIS